MEYNILKTKISYLKGVGPKRAELLQQECGIYNFGQMLVYFPFRYVDRSKYYKINELQNVNAEVQLKGKFTRFENVGSGKGQRLIGYLQDETGVVEIVWFRGGRWILDKIKVNKEYMIFGKPTSFNRKINITHPEVELLSVYKNSGAKGIQPVYKVTETLKKKFLNTKAIAKITLNLINEVKDFIPETLPTDIVSKLNLLSRKEALVNIHHPQSHEVLSKAIYRLKFEEIFFFQMNLIKKKVFRQKNYGAQFPIVGDIFNTFYNEKLPFELTNAQKKVIKEIRRDLGKGTQMNRLLQGDVGSGKTLVALMSMLIAVDNQCQAALMAPTEILAIQHYKSISKMVDGLPIRVELLTGSTKTAKRREIDEGLRDGYVHILVGTHALIEDSVQFQNLALVIIDEQHRFGVAQRAKMWEKNSVAPHILVMTATPIPRSLAMTLYGDMDYSVIDELPPGRKPVKTYHLFDSSRLKVFSFMRKQIEKGQQIYIVYPLIEESKNLDLKDLMDGYDSITRDFPKPKYQISIVHGRMSAEAKEYEMQRFVKGETNIMVATTVIEVGVDVPNASVMVIENAERFGLSQLHQLRGRVGRGAEQSHCILMTKDKLSADARKRIATMVDSSDGFVIAKVDMEIRGPGDLDGTQQSGIAELKIANLLTDGNIVSLARKCALELLEDDPELEKPEHIRILDKLKDINSNKLNWGNII